MTAAEDRRAISGLRQILNQVIPWLIMALMSWVGYSTMALREQMAVMIERSDIGRQELAASRQENKETRIILERHIAETK